MFGCFLFIMLDLRVCLFWRWSFDTWLWFIYGRYLWIIVVVGFLIVSIDVCGVGLVAWLLCDGLGLTVIFSLSALCCGGFELLLDC